MPFNGNDRWIQADTGYGRDGDLRSNAMSESSILHRFAVPKSLPTGAYFPLDSKVDLGVGGEGVIGRRVSLMSDHILVGEGIMGWN